MATAAAGTVWNCLNYFGQLFTADQINTPFLSMIGGLTGGQQTDNFEFPTDVAYSFPAAAQPAITETASLTAPTAQTYDRTQSKNVTQIFQEKVSLSYAKLSNQGRLSGINTAGKQNNVPSEKDFTIAKALQKIARDVEYTFINGVYQIATSAGVANKTRGILAVTAIAGSSTVDALGATLSKSLMNTLLRTMAGNGAVFSNCVLMGNAFQKQKISDIYAYAPMDRNVGGVNIKQIETDFGLLGVVFNRMMPTTSIVVTELSVCAPVSQPVPEKGNLFYEALSKAGASEDGQIFGQLGLNHGPVFMHGSITNLAAA